MGVSGDILQHGLGAAQTAIGAALTASGNPVGVPMMANGINQAVGPGQQQTPGGSGAPSGPLTQFMNNGVVPGAMAMMQPRPQQPPAQVRPPSPMQAPQAPQITPPPPPNLMAMPSVPGPNPGTPPGPQTPGPQLPPQLMAILQKLGAGGMG